MAGRGEDWLADVVRFHARRVVGWYRGQAPHLPVGPFTQTDAASGLPGSTYRLRTGEMQLRHVLPAHAKPLLLVATK